MTWADEFNARCAAEYAEQVAAGRHDRECEQGDGFWICNCSKRRRVAQGRVTPPGDLEFPPPDCPTCEREVWHDGDGWCCDRCALSWSSNGTGAEFTDDHGDLSPCAEHGIRAHIGCYETGEITQ